MHLQKKKQAKCKAVVSKYQEARYAELDQATPGYN
jgi:hypothetical protein